MTLLAIRSAIVETMKNAGLESAVQPHPGRLTFDEITTITISGRAEVRVGCLGMPVVEQTAIGPEITTAWAAYIITMDKTGVSRDETAMLLAGAIAQLVAENTWGRTDLDTPENIRGDNLYSGKPNNQRAVDLWAVTWRQKWAPLTDESGSESSLNDLLRVVVDWDLDHDSEGEPVPTDTIELEGGS